MKAVLTFEDGRKDVIDIVKAPPYERYETHDEYERRFVKEWNRRLDFRLGAKRVTKAHILRH